MRWLGDPDKATRIRVWGGDNGLGAVRLSDDNTGTELARGPSPFEYVLPVGAMPVDLTAVVVAADGELPIFIALYQDGAILPADDGMYNPLNGENPYSEVQLDDPATVEGTYIHFQVSNA